MRTGLGAAIILAAAITQTAAIQQSRGVVTTVTVQPGDGVGVYNFIIRGQNPCGAVRLDPGEGGGITHPIHALPTTLVHDYTRTGNFTVRAEGMGNCDGDVTTTVNVTRVRPRPTPDPPPPPPPPPPTPAPTPARKPPMNTDWSEARFNALDLNNDARITISEWRFGADEFTRVDRNRDSAIVYREFARGAEGQPAQPVGVPVGPRAPGDAIIVSARMPWTDSGISVRAGDLVVVRVGGEIQWAGDPNAKAGPNGVAGRPAAVRAPVPMADLGALVGRVGANGAPFVIGNQREPFRVPTGGRLYLGVNDDVLSDNQGEFYVTISVGRGGLASGTQPPGTTRNPVNSDWSETRFYALDRDSDGRITMSEWRFGAEEFARVDRNRDAVIVLREYIRGADAPLPGDQAGTRGTPPGSIVVSAKTAWTDSGVSVRSGDLVAIRSEGVIQWGPNASATAGPGGVDGRAAASRAPVPVGELGALIGRIGNGPPFLIGNRQDAFLVPNGGRLYLGINDDILFDNAGEFFVTVSVGRSGR